MRKQMLLTGICLGVIVTTGLSGLWGLKAAEPAPSRYSSNPVIAEIDGKPIQLEVLRNKRIHDLEQEFYQNLEIALVEYSMEELSKTHPEIQPPKVEIPEAQIRGFYDMNNLSQKGTYEQLAPQIKDYFTQQMMMQQIMVQYKMAQEKGWVKSYLQAPPEFLVSARVDSSYVRGNVKGKVMLLEFSDYQCPYCAKVQPTLNKLVEKYGDRIAFGYQHYPLPFHTEADEAAIAAECAGDQGLFGEMHEKLFENQRSQQNKDLKSYAKQIKIPKLKTFETCLDQEKYRSKVNRHLEEGKELGINGTPGFVVGFYDAASQTINGEVLSGAQPLQTFEATLEKYLARTTK
ncbi:MAG: thioredoxin domain-containing protein [SAR324 cluster bacterium]|nr:thioredoxin domain-containing protein [SAR324 cluster bacterium]